MISKANGKRRMFIFKSWFHDRPRMQPYNAAWWLPVTYTQTVECRSLRRYAISATIKSHLNL